MNPRNCGYCQACGASNYDACTTFTVAVQEPKTTLDSFIDDVEAAERMKLRSALESHRLHMRRLLESLEYKTTGRDPKNNGFAYAAIPEWAIRQRIDAIDAALEPKPAAMKGDKP